MRPPPSFVGRCLQVTVNNQIVIGTLMNICDDPNRVSVGAGWRENDTIRRVPIIVTGGGVVGVGWGGVFKRLSQAMLGGTELTACPSL